MSPLDQITQDFRAATWGRLAAFVIAALCGGVLWSSIATVDRIALAEGVIAPQGHVRTIQHLEGGIATEIFVREGDSVVPDQPLLSIDLGNAGLNADEIQVRLDALAIERARLQAEAAQIDLVLPQEASARHPDLASAERMTYQSRRRAYESRLAVLRDQQTQKELEIESILSRQQAARRRMDPLSQQRSIATELSSVRLLPKTQSLMLDGEYEKLVGEIAELEIALPRAQAGLAEARELALFERNRFRNEAAERLRAVEIEIAREKNLLERAADQKQRTQVVSPISGIVKNLRVHTIGGVVASGAPILEIVPDSEKLVVDAKLSPDDIGHVSLGQAVRVKISTYNYINYGTLPGTVTHIAADATTDASGRYFFRIVIETERDYLEADGHRYPISPGMAAGADIVLGRRTFLRYLLEPVLRLRDAAFRDG
ncbi:MAG: HlyD family type I secretion periplasmic adaptor subunit [Neomegalonema sp.]|nr:HlyD family type I secretion periplasmic adaptor subunit [Neomegalonema sp.]